MKTSDNIDKSAGGQVRLILLLRVTVVYAWLKLPPTLPANHTAAFMLQQSHTMECSVAEANGLCTSVRCNPNARDEQQYLHLPELARNSLYAAVKLYGNLFQCLGFESSTSRQGQPVL